MISDNLTKISRIVIIITFIIATMYFASGILIPIAFAIIFSLLFYPACNLFEKKLNLPKIASIILMFLLVFTVIFGIGYFFSRQFFNLFDSIKDFSQNLERLFNRVINVINEDVFAGKLSSDELIGTSAERIIRSTGIISKTITSSTTFITYSVLVMVYTFLFLLYRNSFKKFILFHFKKADAREKAGKILHNIQRVAQNYFYGLFLIIFIVGTLNGVGLWAIGLEYPFLFGYFASLLTIIPYIGTFIGGLLPFLYATINYDELWRPIAVVLLYTTIQTIEGNILTPKIVGSRVSLNPFIALLSLFIGAALWGIAGMVLFIPLMAILKVIFDSIQPLKPYGLLLGSSFGKEDMDYFKYLNLRFTGKSTKKKDQSESVYNDDNETDYTEIR
jgi:predicted PurR-regulated permease PerM